MQPQETRSTWQRWRPWLLLLLGVVVMIFELQYVSANSKRFITAWYEFWGESPRRVLSEDLVIIEERPQDRTRASDDVSIESRVTAPAEHAFQGPSSAEVADEREARARNEAR
ncbi:MAG: hypothetical protein ACKO6N_01180 [Myxococcota bacterium]